MGWDTPLGTLAGGATTRQAAWVAVGEQSLVRLSSSVREGGRVFDELPLPSRCLSDITLARRSGHLQAPKAKVIELPAARRAVARWPAASAARR